MTIRGLLAVCLFASWPFLSFVDHNKEQIGTQELGFLVMVFAVTLAVSLVGGACLRLLLGREREPTAVAVLAALLVVFFNYHTIGQSIAVYLPLIVAIPALAFVLCRGNVVVDVLLIAGVAAIALPAFGISHHLLTRTRAITGSARAVSGDALPQRSPNIYYVVTDGYARQDQLRAQLGYDNSEFIGYLAGHGFYVAHRAYANYPVTFLSLPSALSMEYLVTERSSRFSDREMFYAVTQGRNPVVSYLRSHGYTYFHLGSGNWLGSKCGGAEDRCLAGNGELANAFYALTPISFFRQGPPVTTAASIERNLDALYQQQPFFLFAHVFPPHPPRIFERDCQQNTSKLAGEASWQEVGKASYLNDLRCTNRQFVDAIDRILARDPSAIIILHSDHGTAYGVDWKVPIDRWSAEAFEERFSILMALRFPAECQERLYSSLSPVNTFRLAFACLESRPPDPIPDDSYIAGYEAHDQAGFVHRYQH
jgi:hypothetical protein